MTDQKRLTYIDVNEAAQRLADRWRSHLDIDSVYGIPRGGLVPAALVGQRLNVPMVSFGELRPTTLVVDDICDTGRTFESFTDYRCDALYRKPHTPTGVGQVELDGWLVFPWEVEEELAGPEDAVVRILEFVGEDPTREGLLDTPGRVLRSFTEMTEGYHQDPAEILSTMFDESHDQMVVLDGIEFTSLCEHHLLPFVGTAVVGYLPRGRVVGLSKMARLVECFARRLQVQERMTEQIGQALLEHLGAEGVGVVIRAHHSCMGCRGVRKPSAQMTTSCLLGAMRLSSEARSEFLAFARV